MRIATDGSGGNQRFDVSVTTHPRTDLPNHPLAAARIAHAAVAVDSHSEGRDATVLGAALAQATGAELMLLAVEPDLPLIIPGLQRTRVRQETEAMLRETSAELAPTARRKVESESVPRGLERLIRNEHRDLVVVGSSRQGREGEVSIGRLPTLLASN